MRLTEENKKTLKAVIVVIACLYVMSGGFYNRLIKPGPRVYWQGDWYTISPDMGEQTTPESLYAFICNATTVLGFFMMAASGNQKRNRLTSNRLMIIGLGLLLAGWIGSYVLLELKRLPWYQLT